MIPPEAILKFADAQKRLLRRTYDEAWQRGVDAYEPDLDPEPTDSTFPLEMKVAGTTAAIMAARRQRPYQAPKRPDPVRRTIALFPAFYGLNKMVGELTSISTATSPLVVAAQGDMTDAVDQWALSNAWRLDAGESVAWAGEQAGYAEAADTDGQYLWSWETEGDVRVCGDCELLGGFPPMPLGDWPTSPGAGDTECNAGCRCTWETWDTLPAAGYVPQLSAAQSDLMNTLSERQAQALDAMMPDVAYLE